MRAFFVALVFLRFSGEQQRHVWRTIPWVISTKTAPPALQQFVDDELLRAPLLFDQVVDGTVDATRKALPELAPLERSLVGDLMQALLAKRARLSDYFVHSLRQQAQAEMARSALSARAETPGASASSPIAVTTLAAGGRALTLDLVDEEEVAVDVQLSHTIEAIKSLAEHELRELQTFVSALVGDMDLTRDHNPLRPEAHARALWTAAHALPLTRGHQMFFMRHAAPALAQVLRRSYAAASSRLESQGIEPAAYRTLILPTGSRLGWRGGESTFSPDLHVMRSSLPTGEGHPGSSRGPMRSPGQAAQGKAQPKEPSARWREVAAQASNAVDRQSVELISRLFDAIARDRRLPADVKALLARLHGPAMRLALRDADTLAQDGLHPLWRFINRLAYEAEMAPDGGDPERLELLKLVRATVEQINAEPEQNAGLYRWAGQRLDNFLQKRLARRITRAASQIGALQKLEDRLVAGHSAPTTLSGTLDVQQLDTVPADLFPQHNLPDPAPKSGIAWLEALRAGDWVRMFMKGRWVQAQLLWPGERREVWLFGDGASDTTWAVRRRALTLMHDEHLIKGLSQRSLLRSAAKGVQREVLGALPAAAAPAPTH